MTHGDDPLTRPGNHLRAPGSVAARPPMRTLERAVIRGEAREMG